MHNRESITTKWKILFLDEAHALKPTAADSLLKDIEEPRAGVLFALATTEPWELKPTLKSRTLPLEVRPLSAPDAVDFLETIARREGIFYDRDALLLLACVADAFGLASAPFASITTYERDLGGVLGRVVAHVPALVESPAAEDALLAWCESLQSDDGDGLLVRVEAHQGAPDARAMKFHWNCAFMLCAAAQDGEGASGGARQLLDDLRVSKAIRRQSGPIRHAVLEISGALSSVEIEGARANGMDFLSAFDARAWSWIRRGGSITARR